MANWYSYKNRWFKCSDAPATFALQKTDCDDLARTSTDAQIIDKIEERDSTLVCFKLSGH